MKDFNRDSKFGKKGPKRFDNNNSQRFSRDESPRSGGRDFDRFERRDSDSFEKKMYPVTCAKCGKACEVPFRPSGDKPVYCSNCFRKNDEREERRPSSSGPSGNELEQINKKLDKIMEALEID